MSYALFIATNPEPVSDSEWTSPEAVFDRARLSSGGTKVEVRSASNGRHEADDFDTHVATFVNGIRLEIRDQSPEAFAFYGDDRLLATAKLTDGEWLLTADPSVPVPGPNTVAYIPDAGHTHREVEVALSKFVEDWLQ